MQQATADPSEERSGLIAGFAAFITWGLVPVYWKMLKAVPAQEILAHRFVWTSLFLILLISWQGRWGEVRESTHSIKAMLYCLTSGSAIAINWFFFIWAVNAGHIIETSLGYFMTPLVNVLFGALFLRERLTRLQLVSVSLATAAVLNLTFRYGRFPWIALVLCFSFGIYGLLRKKSGTRAIPGLFFETMAIVPIAIIYLLILHKRGDLIFAQKFSLAFLLMISGVVTGLPLVWFGHAARHLRLTTVGFLQYLAPSCTFFLGVFAYHENFTRMHLITFCLIWIALAIFTIDAIWRWRSLPQSAAALARPA
jgi:chloramphenicol-sensitive protein RarD